MANSDQIVRLEDKYIFSFYPFLVMIGTVGAVIIRKLVFKCTIRFYHYMDVDMIFTYITVGGVQLNGTVA